MVKIYENAKVFQVIDNTTGDIFIGSTCEPNLSRKLAQYVSDMKAYYKVGSKAKFRTVYAILANENYNIELLENYPCKSQDELNQRVGHYIRNNENVINRIKEGLKSEEECKRIKLDSNPKIMCECGKEINKRSFEKHKESIRHKVQFWKTE